MPEHLLVGPVHQHVAALAILELHDRGVPSRIACSRASLSCRSRSAFFRSVMSNMKPLSKAGLPSRGVTLAMSRTQTRRAVGRDQPVFKVAVFALALAKRFAAGRHDPIAIGRVQLLKPEIGLIPLLPADIPAAWRPAARRTSVGRRQNPFPRERHWRFPRAAGSGVRWYAAPLRLPCGR